MNDVRRTDAADLALDPVALEERLDIFLDPVLSSRRTAVGLARNLASYARLQQEFVLSWVEVISRNNGEMAYQFAAYAPQVLDAMDEAGAEAWIIHFMDVYDKTGLYPGISALQDIESFIRRSEQQATGVLFEEVVGVLEPFVHGLSGRKLKFDIDEVHYTDTETLFLPDVVAEFDSKRENFSLFKAIAVHQWAQCWFGTYRAAVLEQLLALEDAQTLDYYFCLETIRLDACVGRELPGLHREITQLRNRLGQSLVPPQWQELVAPLTQTQAKSTDSLALLPKVCHLPLAAPLFYQGVMRLDRVSTVLAARAENERQAFQVMLAKIADEVNKSQANLAEVPREEPSFGVVQDDEQDPAEQKDLQITVEGQPVAPPPDAQALMSSIIQDFGEIPPEYLVAAGDGGYKQALEEKQQDKSKDVWKGTYHEEGAFLYNEWDFKRRHYRKNWCVLRELDVVAQSVQFHDATMIKYGGLVKSIRRTFEIFRGEDKVLKKQPSGDEVDIDALVEAYADAKTGIEVSDRLFAKKHKEDRNIAVMFMVDMSGSTKGWINDAEREALILLCEALETLGDQYAIYGFSGMTRKRCEVFRIKQFDEAYDNTVKGRICGIKPQDYTRMGVTIRHLSKLLLAVEARTKMLITLSDGKPDDYDAYRGDYGIEDTRQALIEAKRNGIHPFCITIDTEASDYLPHMYGAVNYTVIDEVRKLPLRVSDIYRKLTT